MVCEHLSAIERALLESGFAVISRGKSWSENCREWVYFDGYLDTQRIRERFALSSAVQNHTHRGLHEGQEHGLICTACHDALMGLPDPIKGKPEFPVD